MRISQLGGALRARRRRYLRPGPSGRAFRYLARDDSVLAAFSRDCRIPISSAQGAAPHVAWLHDHFEAGGQ
jgi:hypothetical protein